MTRFISVKYSKSGLNSKRLIMNSIVDAIRTNRPNVEVSSEVDLSEILEWVRQSYQVDAQVMDNGKSRFLSMFVTGGMYGL